MDKLPRGRHGLDPAYVAARQRERLLVAVAELAAERGYPAVSVSAVCKCAAVSKGAFYRQFAGREECFALAFDNVLAALRERLLAACAGETLWARAVRAALLALLEWAGAEPPPARLLLVESLRAGRPMLDRYQAAVEGFAPLLARDAPREHPAAALELTDRAVCGGVASLLSRHLIAGEKDLRSLLPLLVEFVLTPYLGLAEARRVAGDGAGDGGG